MAFSKSLISLAFFICLGLSNPLWSAAANDQTIKAEPDNKGSITFTLILDNLPLNQNDLLAAASDYLSKEYKTARYKEIKKIDDKGIVYGEGELNSFYTDNGIAEANTYSVPFFLRFDCKDGRARVQLIAKNYVQKVFSEINEPKTTEVVIVEQPPFADGKKKYKKVYNELEPLANKILQSAASYLKAATPTLEAEEW